MKTKLLLLSLVFVVSTFFGLSAQELLISEDFSSPEWQTELYRLNDGVNPNASAIAYVTPVANTAFATLNSVDLYFGKYRLDGAIESRVSTPNCAVPGITHEFGDVAVGFRWRKADLNSAIELPEIPSAGTITLHIRSGNETKGGTVILQKFENDAWSDVYTFEFNPADYLATKSDEVLTYDMNSSSPVTLRVAWGSGVFVDLFRIDVTSYGTTGIQDPHTSPVKIIGRTLVVPRPMEVSIYNLTGVLLFQKDKQTEFTLPASVSNGIYFLKSELGTQKIYIK